MMIHLARHDQFPAAREIWMRCFGDDEDYTGFLFQRLIRPENLLVASPGGRKPAAMLCLEPFTLVTPRGKADAVYVFGVATLPEWRGKGLSSTLLEEVGRVAATRGLAVSVLVPGGESLFRFYEQRGYTTGFFARKFHCSTNALATNARPFRLAPAAFEEWAAARNRFFAGRKMFVRWDDRYLRYIDLETRALGGDVFSVFRDDHEGYVVCYPYRDRLIVKESTVPESTLPDVLAALHARYRTSECHVHLPSDTPAFSGLGEVVPFAMLRWHDATKRDELSVDPEQAAGMKEAFMAHVLDGPTLGATLRPV